MNHKDNIFFKYIKILTAYIKFIQGSVGSHYLSINFSECVINYEIKQNICRLQLIITIIVKAMYWKYLLHVLFIIIQQCLET